MDAVKARIILVEPMHDANVGSVARAMKNFGYTELALVRPRCTLGLDARKWGKHAEDVLTSAKRHESIAQAAKGCTVVVGTTGVPERYAGGIKTCLTPRELAAKLKPGERYALVFGPEDRGLDQREIEACDILCTIPMSFGVMNLSHAVAALLYELHESARAPKATLSYEPAPREKVKHTSRVFASIVERLPRVRDKKKVARAFEHVLDRARPTDDEIQAMLAALGEVWKRFGKPGLVRIRERARAPSRGARPRS